jgi:two-component system CheB/CheR fusion protein
MSDHGTLSERAALPSRSGLVVVVGASAGALEALRTLLGNMPADSGVTFVVVVHSSSRSTWLVELLQPYTQLSVRGAEADVPLEANTVVVVAAGADVAAVDSHLRLVASPMGASQHARIDRFFRAVAAAHGARAVGIVLTGAGSDGALGLRQVKDRGGLTIAQAPTEAEWASMPRSAIDTGAVDLVLPLREMPSAILRYLGTPRVEQDDDSASTRLDELLELLESRTGRDFSVYRRSVLTRRVGKRMRLNAIDDWSSYLAFLRSETGEAKALANDLLSNVTDFFADPKAFARLESDVLPRLFAHRSGEDTLRAWVVGCSTGEEAYSIAIALSEQSALCRPATRVQVFASEMADESLERARVGLYPLQIEDSIAPARLQTFFVRDDKLGYRVRAQLRSLVVFASHDVINDFPFSQLDLIVCRGSLLEDLNPDARLTVLRNFHYALRQHGLLVVDSGATVGNENPQLFAADGDGVYRRLARAEQSASLPPMVYRARPPGPLRASNGTRGSQDVRLIHLELLERYAPASVLVDADARVVHYSARAGRFVRFPGGEPTHELMHMLREPLRSAVHAGIEAVDRHGSSWASDALLVHAETGVITVAVHVEPAVSRPDAPANAKVIVFRELGPGESVDPDSRSRDASDFTAELELELEEASRHLRAVVANGKESVPAREAVGEARDGALLSVLADIESAKEELQNINEELMSLDRDNRTRVEELARVSADLEVLLESTGLATLFLDRDLKVVRFTPPLLEIFHVLPSDKGRPLAELNHRLRDADVVDDAGRVLKHMTPVEREAEADNGKWYLLRMLPYRSAPQGLGGVAMTLVDITSRKLAELALRENDRRKDEFIALLAHELRNPLAPISSGIEILRRNDVDRSVAERITLTMSRQTGQLVRLIDDLLDVSRISSGRLQLRKARVALADIVRDAVAAVQPLIDRSRHELSVDLPRERILLDADAARLTQVLANLLNNAARYTPSGGKIAVRARRDGNHVVVAVQDNGFGMSNGVLQHVFEMFYQGGDPRAARQTGLGIGLALAKSLVEMHGGTISVASGGVNRGSEFTLRLPVLDQTAFEPSVAETSGPALGGHRVLVVDDNADAAQTLAVLIGTLGENDVHVALSGEEALPLAKRIKPDTVFLDLKMPEMDGYEVAQRLRQEPWCDSTWLVALTGWGLDEHKRRTKDAGFDQHLTKPADRAALEAILSRPAAGRH